MTSSEKKVYKEIFSELWLIIPNKNMLYEVNRVEVNFNIYFNV